MEKDTTSFQNKLKKLLKFKNDNEKLEYISNVIQLNLIDQLIKQGWTKDKLAKELKTSKGYLTQIYSCDKPITLKFLARLSRIGIIIKLKFI